MARAQFLNCLHLPIHVNVSYKSVNNKVKLSIFNFLSLGYRLIRVRSPAKWLYLLKRNASIQTHGERFWTSLQISLDSSSKLAVKMHGIQKQQNITRSVLEYSKDHSFVALKGVNLRKAVTLPCRDLLTSSCSPGNVHSPDIKSWRSVT